MTELRIGKRGYCSIEDCGRKMALPRWDGQVRGVRFSLCSVCMAGRYSDVCQAIDEMLAKECRAIDAMLEEGSNGMG